MYNLILSAFAVIILSSCSKGFGNRLTDPDIDVYFEFSEDEAKANALGKYWKKNGLTGEEHQSIRLTKDDEYYYVQLIARDKTNASNIPFAEMKLLMELQQALDSAVFSEDMGCQLVICNGRFEPLFNINH